ncbi:hypothetical protein METBIDRAFT_41878 [Metschnikowia bicuspidata var. bicuspidata NRRL YB-4993]|uniref:BRCT domain-containing protein n=1 Tax=Metschnikowia bicuspidata var. bicuspidata NRRL YB-4993 TaxID=869754 RepID=A0A1A0HAR3_9ASCO|nr:hypothetical protein METBIDRAFT_41878 [Metschnikowia bicuspidata var. bicuspidata NRRL YB-4993]OBA21106.1 hypothetical protein METBIDRAFT_41878 [Metschnikowia bicuspidata var. bicuspidata NRRL YB-4993]
MSKPFLGMNFCCTGLVSAHRQQLGSQITAMGGTLHSDLMSLVDYLVVGGRRTEKYKYSVRYRHDIAFVSPEAVADLHARWVAGADNDLDIRRHLLPVFSGFTVCVARVDRPLPEHHTRLFGERFRQPPAGAMPPVVPQDPFLATDLIGAMQELGADVSATLTSDCAVLVGTAAEGKRYRMALEWHVPVVHPMWVYDSCLRGAALHLDDYELTPGAPNLYSSTLFAWKSLYLTRLRPERVLVAVVEKRERPVLKKTSDVWTSIMSSTHVPVAKQVQGSSSWAEALALGSGADPESGAGLEPAVDSSARAASETHTGTGSDADPGPQLFRGLTFLPVGLSVPEQNLLRRVVESHRGAVATASDDVTISHILLRVRDGPQAHLMLLMLPRATVRRVSAKQIAVVTDWFVERSVYYNALRQDAWCRPMPGLVPLLRRFKVCVSGFTGVELLHIEKLVGLLNLEFCDVFSSKRDLLVVNINVFRKTLTAASPALFDYAPTELLDCPVYTNGDDSRSVSAMSTRNKINAAKKWNIPVVSAAYLWEMVQILGDQPNLKLPEISDRAWCIFAPNKSGKFSSLIDFASGTGHKQGGDVLACDEEPLDVRVQLPSPRKSKDKHRYGRLVGGGESLTDKILRSKEGDALEDRDGDGEADISINDENLTQVGYGSAGSNMGENDLWKKVEDLHERLPKRRRTRG